MTESKFEELEVYRLAEKLSDLIWEMVIKWDYFQRNTLGMQYVDACDSISSNISEGYGKGSFADRSGYAKISRGSLFETIHWTKKSYRRKLLSENEFNEINDIIEILLPKLSSYINYLNEKAKAKK